MHRWAPVAGSVSQRQLQQSLSRSQRSYDDRHASTVSLQKPALQVPAQHCSFVLHGSPVTRQNEDAAQTPPVHTPEQHPLAEEHVSPATRQVSAAAHKPAVHSPVQHWPPDVHAVPRVWHDAPAVHTPPLHPLPAQQSLVTVQMPPVATHRAAVDAHTLKPPRGSVAHTPEQHSAPDVHAAAVLRHDPPEATAGT
jgi:hypothetical protein